MTFELRVRLYLGDEDKFIAMKTYEDLDFIPNANWNFKYGDLELDVHYVQYNPVSKQKVIFFAPVTCEDQKDLEDTIELLKGYGWQVVAIKE